ncbi:MAG: hypothetical protein HZB68_01675 [Candidatus Aenigmarchaeota archaeon]|nr:hypothetical protein [Candidatus Aenigmarchaeota archaeon]
MQTDKGTIQYLYVVDKDTTNFKHGDVTSTDSLKIQMLGKTLKITSIGVSQITMELGTELALKVGDTATVDGKAISVTSIGQTSVAVKVGSDTKFIGSSTTADTTETISGLKVTVPKNGILYTQEAESRQVQLRVGSETSATVNNADPLKQFGEPDDATAAKWTWVITNTSYNDISVGAKFNWQLDSKTEDYGGIAFAGQSYDFPSNFGGVLFDSLVESNFRQYSVTQESSLDASNAHASLTSMPVYVFTASGVTNEGFTVKKAGSSIDTHIVYVNNSGGIFYKDSNGKIQFASTTAGTNPHNFTISYGDISGTNGIVVKPTNATNDNSESGAAAFATDRFYLALPEHYTGVGTKNLTLAAGP